MVTKKTCRADQKAIVDQCRGLIINDEGLIVARPFPAIHDLRSQDELPPGSFTVTDKVDGTLGIMYWLDDQPHIATRRAFEDNYGRTARATEVLRSYAAVYPFRRDLTYLWESVDSQDKDRYLVDYGDRRDLTLLAIIETATGRELPLPDREEVPFPVVPTYPDIHDTVELRAEVNQRPNTEGFVIRMDETGERFRIKSDTYTWQAKWRTDARKGLMSQRVRVHFINGGSFESLISRVPEMDRDEVERIAGELQAQYNRIEQEARSGTGYPKIASMIIRDAPYARKIWEATSIQRREQ